MHRLTCCTLCKHPEVSRRDTTTLCQYNGSLLWPCTHIEDSSGKSVSCPLWNSGKCSILQYVQSVFPRSPVSYLVISGKQIRFHVILGFFFFYLVISGKCGEEKNAWPLNVIVCETCREWEFLSHPRRKTIKQMGEISFLLELPLKKGDACCTYQRGNWEPPWRKLMAVMQSYGCRWRLCSSTGPIWTRLSSPQIASLAP